MLLPSESGWSSTSTCSIGQRDMVWLVQSGLPCFFFMMILAGGFAGRLFLLDAAVVGCVDSLAPVVGLAMWTASLKNVGDALLYALSLNHVAFKTACVTGIAVLMPAAYVLAFPAGLGIQGLWISVSLGNLACAAVAWAVVARVDWAAQAMAASERAEQPNTNQAEAEQ
ncbi:unnamed protein product [Polarella glacialis]|uniref:Uncharacterized protein n=1 Tax=Polarella glacialis TaxID=89957 RepID=A0A813K0B9_POLGL|nr:unnamed protein product [Polarella glacialis]